MTKDTALSIPSFFRASSSWECLKTQKKKEPQTVLFLMERDSGDERHCVINSVFFRASSSWKCLKTQKKEPQTVLFLMERETRLELATSSLARRHSTTELPPQILLCVFIIHGQKKITSG